MHKSVERICRFAVAGQVFPLNEAGSMKKEYIEDCA